MQRVEALAAHPLVGHARGVGLIAGLELVEDKASKAQYPVADKVALQVVTKARGHGLILRAIPGDSVGICPPLIISETQIHEMFDSIARSLDDVHQHIAK